MPGMCMTIELRGGSISRKKDRDLFRGEADDYSSYGDTEGDGTLEGAVYGLFAAEDIVHPDAEVTGNGILTNTGVVYKKNDLVATAATDQDGNADFLCYTEAPGVEYDYTAGKIRKRTDISWNGPGNLYQENMEKNGNWWIGRPLILGKYYIKELSRSEGYELSVNGMDQEITNRGAGFETPGSVTDANGTAVVTMPELTAAMEGDDGSGKGYDELPFTVTSAGTAGKNEDGGYEIFAYGFPEGTRFYRADAGEELVTGPHVTGTEEVIVKDEAGRIVWKRAESDSSDLLYQPERDAAGNITGQEPVSRIEPQILKAEQIPEKIPMSLSNLSVDEEDERFQVKLEDCDLSDETSESFLFLKAQTEEILGRNGYEVPVTAGGVRSLEDMPVYSRGSKKGPERSLGNDNRSGRAGKKDRVWCSGAGNYSACRKEFLCSGSYEKHFHLVSGTSPVELLRNRWDQKRGCWLSGNAVCRCIFYWKSQIFYLKSGKWEKDDGQCLCGVRGSGKSPLGVSGI